LHDGKARDDAGTQGVLYAKNHDDAYGGKRDGRPKGD
jgi:hypothetical protein